MRGWILCFSRVFKGLHYCCTEEGVRDFVVLGDGYVSDTSSDRPTSIGRSKMIDLLTSDPAIY